MRFAWVAACAAGAWLTLTTACGRGERATRDSALAYDSALANGVSDTTTPPRVVPYDPTVRRPPAAPTVVTDTVGDPAAVVRQYYAAIRAHDFLRAYRMWEASGQTGGRSFAQFESGFDSTESVDVKVGVPGRVEGAAGSRYVTVPVELSARLRNGTGQRFSGSYTLRRVVVPGVSAAQRRWHLYAANIRQVQ